MNHEVITQLQRRVSGAAALGYLTDLSQMHRIQSSPGYRQAAAYVADCLASWGIEPEVYRYPAKVGANFWSCPSFEEWWADEGWLDLVSPPDQARRLADWEAVKLSLVPRSASWEGEAPLVHVPDGRQDSQWEGVEAAGAVVLTRSPGFAETARQAQARGAAALLFYGMRDVAGLPAAEGHDLPDAIQYVSFWYFDRETPHQTAFAISPREGRRLVALIEQAQASGQPAPRVCGRVRARFGSSEFSVISATFRGTLPDEVLIISHLCHPQPFANDNASGVAAALEAVRVLAALRAEGQLTPPLRTLRFLWLPEMTGTYAYLQQREAEGTLGRLLCGLNLDMVGERQEVTGSVLLLERPSEAIPGFATDLIAALRQALFAEASSHGNRGRFPTVRLAETPFSGGSDHMILSDPTVGCDTPMLIQWPDRFYHTTADTVDKSDPASLARAATLAATYGWWVASASSRQVHWLAHELHSRWRSRVMAEAQIARSAGLLATEVASNTVPASARLRFLTDRQQATMERLRRLDPEFDPLPWRLSAGQFALEELSCLDDAKGVMEWPPQEDFGGAANRIPRRVQRGPLMMGLSALSAEQRAQIRTLSTLTPDPALTGTLVQYWIDGHRTLSEVAEAVALEIGFWCPDFVKGYCDWLVEVGAVVWTEHGD
jgi:aminopeptidase YwaD